MGLYYSGGLAELNPHPTPLTYSFFRNWFTGENSLGRAMNLLHLPYEKTSQPLLVLHGNEMVVNLQSEEDTLYYHSLFSYAPRSDINLEPQLRLNYRKLFDPQNYATTLQLLAVQTSWLVNPEKIVSYARNRVAEISESPGSVSLAEIDNHLSQIVWPAAILVGALAQYFHRVIDSSSQNSHYIWSYTSAQVAKHDWFFNSLMEQKQVQAGTVSFANYLSKYGLRSDNDYELSSPRWWEHPQDLKKKVFEAHFPTLGAPATINLKNKKPPLVNSLIELQILRSEARRKALIYINTLRQAIIKKAKTKDIASFSREDLFSGKVFTKKAALKKSLPLKNSTPVTGVIIGQGIGVSAGKIIGTALQVNNNSLEILSGTIGIFPNATPEFTTQFPKCAGLIFLRGGATSHGAIVAREFTIPAIISADAQNIPDHTQLELDGQAGSWKILSPSP